MTQVIILIKQIVKAKIKYFISLLNNKSKINSGVNVKRAAICYLGRVDVTNHTNSKQQSDMKIALEDEGYIVDLYNNCDYINSKKNSYKLIVGFGESWRKLCKINDNALKILYSTEAPPFYSYINESYANLRTVNNQLFFNKTIRSYKFYCDDDYINADFIFQMGSFNCELINMVHPIKKNKIFEMSTYGLGAEYSKKKDNRTNTFLWFGSHGSVHKGLDLIIDYFKRNKNVKLIIAGSKEEEIKPFDTHENIRFVGTVNVPSSQFDKLINEASFCILPSASEGISTSVATCMYYGLIPIISRATNISCKSAVYINPIIEDIELELGKLVLISDQEFFHHSEIVREYANENFTKENYADKLREAIKLCN